MNDLISLFKDDLYNLVNQLKNNDLIDHLNKKNISIDYSSKSKQGDLSTNILIVLLKKNLNKQKEIKEYINNYILNLEYVEKIDIAKVINPIRNQVFFFWIILLIYRNGSFRLI